MQTSHEITVLIKEYCRMVIVLIVYFPRTYNVPQCNNIEKCYQTPLLNDDAVVLRETYIKVLIIILFEHV